MIKRGCVGIDAKSLPPLGVEGVAIWPIAGSTSSKGVAPIIARIRRHITWLVVIRKAVHCEQLLLVDGTLVAKVIIWIARKLLKLPDAMSCNSVDVGRLGELFDILG